MLRSDFFHGKSSPANVSSVGIRLGCWEHPQMRTGTGTSKNHDFLTQTHRFSNLLPHFPEIFQTSANSNFFPEGVRMSDKNNDKVQSFKFMGKLGAFKNFASVSRKKVKSFFCQFSLVGYVRTYLKSESYKL